MRRNSILLVVISLFLLPALGYNQGVKSGCVVSGHVQATAGGNLEFVTLSLRKLPDSAVVKTIISDGSGMFSFSNVPPGEYLVTASLVGYEKTKLPVFTVGQTCSGPVDLGVVTLGTATKIIGEVVVVSRRPTIKRKLDKTVLNIENSSLASGSTAFEVLQMAPGVTVGNDDNIELFAKGSPLILIDGKPTYLSKENLSNWLKSMSSDMIAEIEIISQPSAKYDAAGVSGIINIKTRRIKTTGFTGNASGGIGYGRQEKYRGNVSLAYKGLKYTVTTDLASSFNNTIRYLDVNRKVATNNGNAVFDRSGNITDKIKSNSFKSTLTVYPNKNNSFGLQLQGYDNRQAPDGYNYTGIFSPAGEKDSSLVSTSDERSAYKSLGGNFNYYAKLDTLGRELSFNADYSGFTNRTKRFFSNTLFGKTGNIADEPSTIRNNFPTDITVLSLKTDITYPLKDKTNIETGWKSSFVTTDNNATFDSLVNNSWKPSLSQNNHFIYKENINALYVNVSKEFKTFSAQAGLRAENTNTDADLLTLNSKTKRNYTSLFPSVFLSRDFKNNNRVSLSYSRRVERPNYQNLNPFRFYDDRYTFHEGNPYLKPAFTNSFEVNSIFKNIYSVLVQYSVSNDVFAEDIRQQTENGVILTSSYFRNYQSSRSLTASVSYSKDINNWWSTDNSITVNHTQFSDNDGSLSRNLKNYNYALNMYQYFQINKTLSVELSGFYRSPSLYGFMKTNPRYKMDIGFKKSLWKKKASIKFKVSDIFNTNRFEGHALYGDVDVKIVNRFESRIAFLTFTCNFGNNKVKYQRKDVGDKEEKDRIKKESN